MRTEKYIGQIMAIIAFVACFTVPLVINPAAVYPQQSEPSRSDLEEILEQINMMNHFAETYTHTTKIVSFAPKKDPLLTVFKVYSKGLDNILVTYVSPKKDKGKRILFKKDRIWMYFPKAHKSIVMSPVSTLFGTVAIGDIVGPPVLDLYEFESAEKVVENDQDGIVLLFTAISNKAPYGRVVYEYIAGNVVYSECYTRSGILLKKAYFSDFAQSDASHSYPTRIKMISEVNPEYYSLIQISDLKKVDDLPDSYFYPDALDTIRD